MSDQAIAADVDDVEIPWTDPAIDAPALDRYVALTMRKRRHEAEVNRLKKELAPLQQQLLDEFAAEGVKGKTTADGISVSLNRRIWARAADGDRPRAAAALKQVPELAEYVELAFNVNSLSSYFRELAHEREEKGEPVDLEQLLPAELAGAIALSEDHQLSVRS